MARKMVGVVTSDVQDKTITVAVNRSVTHPVYGKRYTVTKKYAVHDEKNAAHVGDKVEMSETRPISKRKSWTLSKILETGHAAIDVKDETAELPEKEAPKPKAPRAKKTEEAKAKPETEGKEA
jgi:small subunit ribosomal protein S17